MTGQRICFISLSAYGYFNQEEGVTGGGAQRQVHLLSTNLTQRFDVHVIVGDYGQPIRETYDGITLHRTYPPAKETPLYREPLQFWYLLSAMRRADADLYILRSGPRKVAFVYLITRLLGRKFVFNLANDIYLGEAATQLSEPIQLVYIAAIRNAEGIIAQTEDQAEVLRTGYNIDADVVPNGYPVVDDTRPHDQRQSFLWIGRLEKQQKRPHLYLDLAEKIPGSEFLLIGPDGPDQAYSTRIRERAASLQNVQDVGPVAPDNIHEYYRDAIALVNTSQYEGFPNTFLEAWRYETPVVSLNIDPGRFVNGTVDGYAERDIESLVTLIEDLESNIQTRKTMGKKAANYVNENLSIDTVAVMYASALESALRDH